MNFIPLSSLSQLNEIDTLSASQHVVIFKHSTRCSISDIAYHRLQKGNTEEINKIPVYYLDLIQHRDISNAIAEKYHVYHESPQVLLIKEGECYFDCSHMDISWPLILDEMQVSG